MIQPKQLGGLGFRDLEIFNLALLARQAWRIMNDGQSLSAQHLKVVYFPNSTLLEADLGPRPSQIWRAILDGKEILAQGIIRRIGDGESTDIWLYNWIPRDSFKRPITSLVPNPPQRVSDLIDTTSAQWNAGLIRLVFIMVDANEIQKIPVCMQRQPDFWAWHEEPTGHFTIRLAYQMILQTKTSREGWWNDADGSSTGQNNIFWSTIWHIQVPSKHRMFL